MYFKNNITIYSNVYIDKHRISGALSVPYNNSDKY